MMTKLQKPVAGILSAVFLAAALSGCGESDFDLARKPELIDKAVAAAMEKCDLQDNKPQQIPYDARLRQVLAGAESNALDSLREEGVTVCLDQRLTKGDYGFFDKTIRGVYYPESKIISVWDNGRDPTDQSWYETKSTDWGGESITKFASEVAGKADMNEKQIGATYFCGKGCVTWHWKAASGFKDEVGKNPHLDNAPLAPDVPLYSPATPLLRASLN
ncbi:MAG: hypothetical protein NDJ24_10310 [Alphaproteobacteria bacterium]|nr:hypothetical protein [Alphaproteobacteria bacterium]